MCSLATQPGMQHRLPVSTTTVLATCNLDTIKRCVPARRFNTVLANAIYFKGDWEEPFNAMYVR